MKNIVTTLDNHGQKKHLSMVDGLQQEKLISKFTPVSQKQETEAIMGKDSSKLYKQNEGEKKII